MSYTYDYPHPAVTVDIIIFKNGSPAKVLLIERKNPPFKNCWAFPGGFVDENEALKKAAHRELEEETGLKNIALKQLQAFGDPGRDPRGHTVSVVFWGILNDRQKVNAGDDASKTQWFEITRLPELAFDHEKIMKIALQKLSASITE